MRQTRLTLLAIDRMMLQPEDFPCDSRSLKADDLQVAQS
jgi:hypothetical protein